MPVTEKVIVVENLQKVYKPKSRKQSTEVKAIDGISFEQLLAKARIKAADLIRQRDFYPRQFSRNRFQQFQEIAAGMCRK